MDNVLITERFRRKGPLACKVLLGEEHAVFMRGSISPGLLKGSLMVSLDEQAGAYVNSALTGVELYEAVGYNAIRFAFVQLRRLGAANSQSAVQAIFDDILAALALEKKASASESIKSLLDGGIADVATRHTLARFLVEVIRVGYLRLASAVSALELSTTATVNREISRKEMTPDYVFSLSMSGRTGALLVGTSVPTGADITAALKSGEGLAAIYENLHATTSNPMFALAKVARQ